MNTVFITGASSGIGYAAATYLASSGYTVLGSVRKEKDKKRLAEVGIHPVFPLDLTDREAVERGAATVVEMIENGDVPPLDAVVFIAGGGHVAPIELMDIDNFRNEIEVRMVSTIRLLQYFIPMLRKTRGRIVWIATPGIFPVPWVADIHAPDFAVNYLARTLDIELKPDGIKNILIRCGGINTPAPARTETGIVNQLREISGVTEDKVDIYRERLDALEVSLRDFGKHRIEPEAVGALIGKVLKTRYPKTRYQIGYMSRVGALMENLPQAFIDYVMKRR